MSEPLRIVLAGCGGITSAWLDSLKTLPGISVAGLVDLHLEAAERRRAEYNLTGAQVGTHLAAMLRAVRPQVVFDCTIPDARASVVLTALKHGCHVLSEKPMAANMTQARRLVVAARRAGKIFAVMQNRRYDPRIRAVRDFLNTGAVGEVTTLNGDFYIGAHFGGFRDQMKHVLLLDMAIHSFDQARLISGGDPVAVYCREWNPRGSWYAHGASAIAVFEMSNGAVYTYRGSWCAEGFITSWECDWRIIGTRGTVIWDGGDQMRAQVPSEDEGFLRAMQDLPVPRPGPTEVSGHGACIRDFIACVQSERIPETVCTENIKSLAMVFSAIKSAETGRRIAIKI